MRKDEVIIRIVNKLDEMYGDVINMNHIKSELDNILYDFDITPKSTALVPMNNIQDRIMLYLAVKKTEGLSDKTILSYGRNLGKFMNDFDKNVEDITAMDIRMHLANYSKTGVRNSTIASRTDILRGFFGWLHSEEYISRNPMDKIKTIKVEDSLREPLTPEELEIFYTGCKTLRQKALVSLFVATGCRLEEVERMKRSDIDFANSQIVVTGKGNKTRTVYFNAKAKVHLQKYLMGRLDDCEALFVTERKPIKFMGRRAIQREIDKVKEQSGLKKNVYPHLLRHTYGTLALAKGVDITIIQKLLGHSELSTTQVYAKTSNTNVEYEYKKYMNG